MATLFGLGWLVGTIVTSLIFQAYVVGTLRIDTSDPSENPYMFLELYKGVNKVINKTYIVLKVDAQSYIPHK